LDKYGLPQQDILLLPDIPGLTNLDISGATPDTKKRDILGPKWTYPDSVFRTCQNCDTVETGICYTKKIHNAHHKLFSLQTRTSQDKQQRCGHKLANT